jgi:fructokinase
MAAIVGIGEVLWDVFADQRRLGGAPANFAFHAVQLGHEASIVSRVGNDEPGRELLAALRAHTTSTRYVQTDPQHPTGTVQVALAPDGTPEFTISPNVAWDYLQLDEPLLELARGADAVCFGTLAQRSPATRNTIQAFLAAAPRALKIFDVNLRQHFWSAQLIQTNLAHTHVLKLNSDEQRELARLLGGPGEPLGWARDMIERYKLRLVCITRGPEGCVLVSADGHAEHPGLKVPIIDTVGAGDAFTAALVSGYLAGWPLAVLAEHANRVGAYVASQAGATPPLPSHVRRRPR